MVRTQPTRPGNSRFPARIRPEKQRKSSWRCKNVSREVAKGKAALNFPAMKLANLFVAASVFVLPLGALAQWQWIDKDNRRVFSDKPPPIDIPENNILRRPNIQPKRLATATQAAAENTAAAPAAPAAAAPAKPRGVDKDLEEKARQAEEADKAKQAAEARKIAEAKADNCNRARQGKATMDSGVRVARVNAQGEREILDDAARAAEQQRLQTVIESDCK